MRSVLQAPYARVHSHDLQRAWADFVGRVPWELFVTLSFDPGRVFPVDRQRAEREALRWCQFVACVYRRPVAWLYATERGATGLWHVHVLLAGIGNLRIATAAAVWRTRNGWIHVKPVHGAHRAVLYTTKQACQTGTVVVADTLARYRHQLLAEPAVGLVDETTDVEAKKA